jgi:hypothetical protein
MATFLVVISREREYVASAEKELGTSTTLHEEVCRLEQN